MDIIVKKYPREFRSQTVNGKDCYPQYRHRSPAEGGHSASVRVGNTDTTVDIRHVVPCNSLLPRNYEALIDVERCASMKAVKY